ncbi:MAG: 23S rRNA (adenine(1618)-N(6))-methyltransferase RlmF [Arcobacteraceae bacterium]|nr:23S rRNA (adenine(1618)-N(6))-methyltransferase RlmF [Arcobacteraceae bacterium]
MKTTTKTKTLHSRNLHNSNYDFDALIISEPKLKEFVAENKYGNISIDFANPKAVLTLNQALLSHFYGIKNWELPKDYLAPPIPGRADYIHHIADLLASSNDGVIPKGSRVKGLDIGVGANCIYPMIGTVSYGWQFLATDIDEVSIKSVENIVNSNDILSDKITAKLQKNKNNIFVDIIKKDDKFDFTISNPPFHKSAKEASEGSKRKVQNLTKTKVKKAVLNFAGQANELWCDGGEIAFIKKMINQSVKFRNNCLWFTALVSKKDNLETIYKLLRSVNAVEYKTIDMQQGQKISRIVAWTFLTKQEQKDWRK